MIRWCLAVAFLSTAPMIAAQVGGAAPNSRGFVGEQNLRNAIRNGIGGTLTGGVKPPERPFLQLPAPRPVAPVRVVMKAAVCSIGLLEAQLPAHVDERMILPGTGKPAEGGIPGSLPAPPCSR